MSTNEPTKVWDFKDLNCELRFIKVKKCGSSTNGGVARRIGFKKKLSGIFQDLRNETDVHECSVFANHKEMWKLNNGTFSNVKNERAYTYTFLRDPASRATSAYFHLMASRKGYPVDDKSVKYWLSRSHKGALGRNFMTKYISPEHGYCDGERRDECISNLLHHYDFIGLIERQEESLLVLKFLLGLQMEDILFLSSKQSGGFDDKGMKSIKNNKPSPVVRKYLNTRFKQQNMLDYQLYNAANRSLDATIEFLGLSFQEELVRFRKAILMVNHHCAGKAVFPYNVQTGADQRKEAKKNCYWNDNGCGYPCIDEFVASSEYDSLVTLKI